MLSNQQLHADAIELLCSLCKIPGYSRIENEKTDCLEQWMIAHALVPERHGNNLLLKSPSWDESKPTLLLNSHIDTVRPVSSWTYPPHASIVEQDRIIALGSNDAGASLVTLLQAYRLLTQVEQPYNLLYLASAEEEVSGSEGVARMVPLLPPITLAIVGEPTQMHLAIAEKGLVVYDGLIKGKAGHAAREEGVNAIYKALPIIEALRTFQFEKVSPLLGPVKISVTQIQAGKQHNIVPDRCEFVVDVRTNECYTNGEVTAILQEVSQGAVTPRSERLNSSQLPQDHPLIVRAKGLKREFFGSPTLSDQALMPWPSAKIGPGDSARSHTADEYILRSELEEAIDLYLALLNQLPLTK